MTADVRYMLRQQPRACAPDCCEGKQGFAPHSPRLTDLCHTQHMASTLTPPSVNGLQYEKHPTGGLMSRSGSCTDHFHSLGPIGQSQVTWPQLTAKRLGIVVQLFAKTASTASFQFRIWGIFVFSFPQVIFYFIFLFNYLRVCVFYYKMSHKFILKECRMQIINKAKP